METGSINSKSLTENEDEDEEMPSNVNVQIIRGIGEKREVWGSSLISPANLPVTVDIVNKYKLRIKKSR